MVLMQYILILVAVLSTLWIVYLFKKNKIQFLTAFFILFLILFFLVIVYNPDISNYLANWFGVGRGADFLMYLSILFLFFINFKLYLRVVKLDKQISKIVSYYAIEEFKSQYKNDKFQ